MTQNDPLSIKSLMRWLRVEDEAEIPDIEQLIEAGKMRAKDFTGYDYDQGGKRTEYLDLCDRVPLPYDEVHWTLEIHKNGRWVKQSAEQIGDMLCVHKDCHSCSCDCSSCGDTPKLKLETKPKSCGLVNGDVVTYVKKYVTFHYQNRGDCPAGGQALIDAILRPHMRVAFA